LDHNVVTAIKRQVPFLLGGTITGVIMTYYMGFFVTLLVNSMLGISYLKSPINFFGEKALGRTKKLF